MKGPAPRQGPARDFGELLRDFRIRENLSQNALARAAGLDPTSLNRIENARGGAPRLSTITRIVRALGWSSSDPNAVALREAAGYDVSGDGSRTDREQLRRILARSVAEFNAWREKHEDTTLDLDWSGYDFTRINLRTVDFRNMNLTGARFEDVDLVRANLRDAKLIGASLRLADLRGANFRDADLTDADLRGADLRGANLHRAKLIRTQFRNADLSGADLHDSVLRDANLRKADLQRADLSQADLRGASFLEANLMRADFQDAKVDERTSWDRAFLNDDEMKKKTVLVPIERDEEELESDAS